MLDSRFLLAGKAIFTVEIPEAFARNHDTPGHYTYRLKKAKEGEVYFAQLLTGPNNTDDYTYLGLVTPSGILRLTKASKMTDDSWPVRILRRVLVNLVAGTPERVQEAGFDVHHESRCGRCGRPLTTPESVKAGLGPECSGRAA